MKRPEVILMTGASSGLGEALALEYAAPGTTLLLTGRNADRLSGVEKACAARGAKVMTAALDVTDRAAMADWLTRQDAATPIDLVIANAGISAGTGRGGESEAQARAIFAVNLDGVLNTLQPLLGPMRRRGRGHLAIMSSLASFRGFPGAPAYCASKAAVRVYGEALRGELAGEGVEVSVICPGFVRTPMTAVNDFPMPFLMDAAPAAHRIRKGLEKGQGRIAFPWPMYGLVRLLAALPEPLTTRILARLPKKTGVQART